MNRRIEITTLRTTGNCPDVNTCPSIHRLADQPERHYVVTKKITDPAEAAAFAPLVAQDEQVGWLPAALIPEL